MAPDIELGYAYSGGGSQPKSSGVFVTAGGRTAASLPDRLLDHTQQASDSQKQKNNIRCSDWDYNQSNARLWFLELSVGKGAPWGMVLVASPACCRRQPRCGTCRVMYREDVIDEVDLLPFDLDPT